MNQRRWMRGVVLFGALTVVLLLIGLFWSTGSASEESASADSPTSSAPADEGTTTTGPTVEEDEAECPSSWLIQISDKEDNRWFASGLREIREASSPEEARDAANTWLSLVRRDPQLLTGAAAYFLDQQVDPSTLVDEDGKCASEAAVSLTAEIELALADSEITPEEAPTDGTNSGTNGDGDVVAAETPGIDGDRDAIKITTPDGKEIWVMARCGNPVVKGPAPVPPGPTDQPPVTTPPPGETTPPPPPPGGTTPPPPTTEEGKDPSLDPCARGNCPEGLPGHAPPVTGPASPPAAGRPPATYVPPAPPPPAPPTTSPRPPVTPPPTTSPPATAPPTTSPPTTEVPAPR